MFCKLKDAWTFLAGLIMPLKQPVASLSKRVEVKRLARSLSRLKTRTLLCTGFSAYNVSGTIDIFCDQREDSSEDKWR